MKKESWKILGLLLISIMLISLVANFVAAQTAFERFLGEQASAIFSDWFTGENFNLNIAKVLLTILVAMIVYSVAQNIPGLGDFFQGDKWWVGVIFSAIVGFLGMAFVTPEEVFAILTSYSAMGFALSIALPFIILVVFTGSLAADQGGDSTQNFMKKMAAWVVWAAFLVFIIIRIISMWVGAKNIPVSVRWLTYFALIFTIIALFSVGWAFKKMKELKKEEDIETFEDTQHRANAVETARAASTRPSNT